MNNFQKTLVLFVCAVLLVAGSVFGTLAYLTDNDSVTNTFTVGKVGLKLDEAKVDDMGDVLKYDETEKDYVKVAKVDGESIADYIAKGDRVKENSYHLLPGHTYVKDPTVTVDADSEESYVRIMVEVVNIDKLKRALPDEKYLGDNGVFLLQQTQGVISELQQVVREIFIGNFAKHGTLGMRDIVRKKGGKTVFIEYDLSIGSALSPVYSLMFDLAIKEALGRKRSEGNVYFITDEFRLLPHLKHIDDAVNFGRSMGIKFLVGVQNVEQIYDNYGEERARSIMSGFSTSVIFRLNDEKSREYAKGIFGKNRKQEAYMPIMQSKGLIEELREANVVEDWDITDLDVGEAIIGLPGHEPFKFKFEKY